MDTQTCGTQRVRSTGIMYKHRTSGKCGDSGGGWSAISKKEECEAAAAALDLSDTTATYLPHRGYPPGCLEIQGEARLYFNDVDKDGIDCDSDSQCICTLVCQPSTYSNRRRPS